MKENKVSINIISSFNNSNFSGLLKSSKKFSWKINEVNYNQVFQTLTNSSAKIWKKKSNITLIWTTPESISSEFQKLQNKNIVNSDIIKKDIDYFCSCIKSIIELNEMLSKEKKLEIKNTTPLISEQSNLESIDLVNLFANLEQNLKKENQYIITIDEMLKNVDKLKTIGSLELFLTNKLRNEKK